MRKPNARVAGCSLDHGAARLQEPSLFGIADHVEGCAVLDAAARVLELGFAKDGALGFGGEFVQFYEGGVSDC